MNVESFEQLLANHFYLVEFWADWCLYSPLVKRKTEKLAERYRGRLGVGRVNPELHADIADRLRVEYIPATLFLHDGKVVERWYGDTPVPVISKVIDEHLRTNERNLNGKVALVTGGSRGLGRAISVELARQGAFVAVNYRRNEDEARKTLDLLQEVGGQGSLFQAEVSSADSVATMFASLLAAHKRIDILVNNAGITRDQPFVTMPGESWHDVLETDLHGIFLCSKAAFRPMCIARRGVIINIGSGSGISPRPGQVNYSSAKSALIGFTRSLAREAAPKGIRVILVAPGFIATDMSYALPSSVVEDSLRKIPLGRWGLPEEIALSVAHLVSDDAGFITGSTIIVDGGRAAAEQDFHV
jgi:3-oxoacyl-[acyl-carrier protein] reductase